VISMLRRIELYEINYIYFLKIDTEGAEEELFKDRAHFKK